MFYSFNSLETKLNITFTTFTYQFQNMTLFKAYNALRSFAGFVATLKQKRFCKNYLSVEML